MNTQNTSHSVAIFDQFHWRRDSLVAVMRPWADSLDLNLLSYAPDNEVEDGPECGKVALLILNSGSASLQDSDQQQFLASVQARHGGIPCVVLSDRNEPAEAVTAYKLGCEAFISSDIEPALFFQAFDFVLRGGTYFPIDALLSLASPTGKASVMGHARDSRNTADYLTKRQTEVLAGLMDGKSNKLIARNLKMQEATVKVHVRQIMRKLGVANRTQAALAAQAGLSSPAVDDCEDGALRTGIGLPSMGMSAGLCGSL